MGYLILMRLVNKLSVRYRQVFHSPNKKVGLQLASYQAGKSNLSNVITARQALLEQQLRLIDLQQQQAITTAQLYFAFEEPTLNHAEEQP